MSIRPIKRLAKDTRVFIMTIFYDTVEIARAHKAGAAGFILKRDDWNETIEQLCDESADWKAENEAITLQKSKVETAAVLPRIELCKT